MILVEVDDRNFELISEMKHYLKNNEKNNNNFNFSKSYDSFFGVSFRILSSWLPGTTSGLVAESGETCGRDSVSAVAKVQNS